MRSASAHDAVFNIMSRRTAGEVVQGASQQCTRQSIEIADMFGSESENLDAGPNYEIPRKKKTNVCPEIIDPEMKVKANKTIGDTARKTASKKQEGNSLSMS